MEYVVKLPPDGYTLLINTPPVAINMSLYKNLGFDTVRDLAAVSVFSASPNVLVVHPSVPARSLKELIALARAKPGVLKFSSGSNGTTQHLLDLGAEPVGYTPEEAARFLREEVALWAAVVKASGARAD